MANLLRIARNKSAIYGEPMLLRPISEQFDESGELDGGDMAELRRIAARQR